MKTFTVLSSDSESDYDSSEEGSLHSVETVPCPGCSYQKFAEDLDPDQGICLSCVNLKKGSKLLLLFLFE
jgi:glutaredoxin